MSDKIKDGGPAFPNEYSSGMSLRDYFAAHCPLTLTDYCNIIIQAGIKTEAYEDLLKGYSKMRLDYADAMLKAREK